MSKYSFPSQLVKNIPDALSFEMHTTESGKLMCCIYDRNKKPISEHLAYLNFSEKSKKTYHNCFTQPNKNYIRDNQKLEENFTFDANENVDALKEFYKKTCSCAQRDKIPFSKTTSGNDRYGVKYLVGDNGKYYKSIAIRMVNINSVIHRDNYAYLRVIPDDEMILNF
jgi:hypothetical protein